MPSAGCFIASSARSSTIDGPGPYRSRLGATRRSVVVPTTTPKYQARKRRQVASGTRGRKRVLSTDGAQVRNARPGVSAHESGNRVSGDFVVRDGRDHLSSLQNDDLRGLMMNSGLLGNIPGNFPSAANRNQIHRYLRLR